MKIIFLPTGHSVSSGSHAMLMMERQRGGVAAAAECAALSAGIKEKTAVSSGNPPGGQERLMTFTAVTQIPTNHSKLFRFSSICFFKLLMKGIIDHLLAF